MAAVHRISPILARQGPNQLHMTPYDDLVEFVRAWCVLWRLQWGASRQRKRAEVLNDPKGIWGADFDQISVSKIFDVIVRTTYLVLWAMQHRWNTDSSTATKNTWKKAYPVRDKTEHTSTQTHNPAQKLLQFICYLVLYIPCCYFFLVGFVLPLHNNNISGTCVSCDHY